MDPVCAGWLGFNIKHETTHSHSPPSGFTFESGGGSWILKYFSLSLNAFQEGNVLHIIKVSRSTDPIWKEYEEIMSVNFL